MGEAIAAVDCGTNTIKLLIGTVADDGSLLPVVRESRMVRLGEAVDRTGRLSESAIARTFGAIDEYADFISRHDVARIRFCATSATRDAANAEMFANGVADRLGVRPEVLRGIEEAALAFAGSVARLGATATGPVLVIDIGGGSTELIFGEGSRVITSDSMDIGAVRLHERHLMNDPPSAEEVAGCVADIEAALDACPVSSGAAETVIGVAGTVTTIAAAVLDLPVYDRERIDQQIITVADVHAQTERLVAMSVEDRRALPFMHPGRADVIDAGALILSRVLRRVEIETMLVSESDILDGIAQSLIR